MTDFYKKLIEKSGFDEALISHALDFSKNINISEFSHLFFDTEPFSVENTGVLYFEEAFYPFNFFSNALAVFAEKGLSPKAGFLYVYISLLENAYGIYLKRNVPQSVFFDTAKTISASYKEYKKDTGKHGLYDYHFLANHLIGNILRLGEFEYQYGHYNEKKAIFMHVPIGADLSCDKRLLSYKLARKYFGDYPIVADSWLLYPEHKKMLSADSKILDFMDDFNIVSVSKTTDYAESFHVFGRLSDYSYENLPQNTSLQKAYAERVNKGLPIGSGVGILKY